MKPRAADRDPQTREKGDSRDGPQDLSRTRTDRANRSRTDTRTDAKAREGTPPVVRPGGRDSHESTQRNARGNTPKVDGGIAPPLRRDPTRERANVNRLNKLAKTEPERAKRINAIGESVARATHRSVQVSVAATLGACGVSTSWNFWDPTNGYSGNHYNNSYWWSCNSWLWYGCSTYWWPGGPRWSFQYCYDNFGYSWSYYPYYYSRPYYASYCVPPAYYSYVVYDYASPAPVADSVVIYSEPTEVAAPAGENVVLTTEVQPGPAAERPHNPAITEELGRAASQYLTLGDQAFKQSRYGDAVHFYAKAVELSPNDAVLHLVLSDALFATGDYHYAAYSLRRALEIDATLLDAIVDKHAFYGDPAEFDRQLQWLERYLEEHFLDDDARLLLAANYLFGNQPARAVELLDSTFSLEVRQTPAGKLILERARALR